MQNRSDTPGEGLAWADENMAMHWIDRYASGIDAEPQMDRILKCVTVGSDTAGPSDHAGLVARLEAADVPLGDLPASSPHTEYSWAMMHIGKLRGLIREAIAAHTRAPEVVAVKPLEWLDHPGDGSILRQGSTGRTYRFRALHAFGAYFILDDADGDFFLYESGEQHSDFMFPTLESAQAAAQADYERRIKSALVGGEDDKLSALATPPAPQPALALIEELERALISVKGDLTRREDLLEIQDAAFRRIDRALASAKRFKGA